MRVRVKESKTPKLLMRNLKPGDIAEIVDDLYVGQVITVFQSLEDGTFHATAMGSSTYWENAQHNDLEVRLLEVGEVLEVVR